MSMSASSSLDKQTAGCYSPYDWLMSLAKEYVQLKMVPIDAFWLFSALRESLPTTLWLTAQPALYHHRNACGIGYTSEKLYM